MPTRLDNVVVHNDRAAIWRCRRCNSLWRELSRRASAVAEHRFRSARYAPARLELLRRRALADLDREHRHLVALGIRRGARVLELGCYTGAFLDFARASGCDATGLDINADVIRFSRARGLDARLATLPETAFATDEFDAIWIANCFEQLADPMRVLDEVARILRPGGTLTIRTPNADFLGLCCRPATRGLAVWIAAANGLTGVPFARCFAPTALAQVLATTGFVNPCVVGREFSAQRPVGWPRWWSALRPLRLLAYRVASFGTGAPVHPWLEATAFSPSLRAARGGDVERGVPHRYRARTA
jgi:SAM-dependent methyltransferase